MPVTLLCEGCGDEYEKYPSEAEGSRFCSMECRKNRVTLSCEECGDEYEVYECREKESRFCSRECKDNYMTGKNHPFWKGGGGNLSRAYNRTFSENRLIVIERDGGCVVCRDERVNVHHIRPLRDYSDNPTEIPDEAHHPSNLVCLCNVHHGELEGKWTDLDAEAFKERVDESVK